IPKGPVPILPAEFPEILCRATDPAEHPALGLAGAAGHVAPAPGDPHVLRLPRCRHRPLRHRWKAPAGHACRARAERVEAAESSRRWINEKLIYTHGYGITMNAVNGFTPEGLPALLVKDMPVQSASADLTVGRPEIYLVR